MTIFESSVRRRFVENRKAAVALLLTPLLLFGTLAAQEEPFGDPEEEKPPTRAYREAVRVKGVGVKIGEVTATSAILWARVPPEGETGYERKKDALQALRDLFREDDTQVRFRYGAAPDLSNATWSDWEDADDDDDYTYQWTLEDLAPRTRYYFEVEGANPERQPIYEVRRGEFRTAPAPEDDVPVTFTVITGQRYDRLDHPDGFLIYDAMRKLAPDFLVATGDSVYLDRGPLRARNIELARDRWRRTFELPRLFEFYAHVPVYFEKDDHDILRDDVDRSAKPLGELTFEDGLTIFREHTPTGGRPYRTIRWGKLLQIWLTEVREFRDDNKDPDGPGKSIFGETQLQWLKSTLAASDATWRVLINPTPIVGPDRQRRKRDNHANNAWDYEGDHIRRWFSQRLGDSFFIVNGDRHWQYHSVDPFTGVEEYSCGPATDEHAGGSPGKDENYHRFHRVGGGFVSVKVERDGEQSFATIRFHSVDGSLVYSDTKVRPIN